MTMLQKIQLRLTNHLAGEASLDFHTEEARMDAISEAYQHISERWSLWTGDLAQGATEPSDFYSWSETPGKYNRVPPPLVNQTDQPWGGKYPQFHELISFYAAFRLYQDRGPEMYERSTFWKQMFDDRAAVIDRTLNRRLNADLQDGEATEDTWDGLQKVIAFYLDTSGMTPEEAQRVFPANVRQGALRRAYREITIEHELSLARFDTAVAQNMTRGVAYEIPLPPDFLAPLARVGYIENGQPITGGQHPYTLVSSEPSFAIRDEDGTKTLVVQNFEKWTGPLSINYVAAPPALVSDTDKPWGGLYPIGNKLIALRAMRDLMRGSQKTFQFSRFWQNEYDREVVAFKKYLKSFTLGQANRVMFGHAANTTINENSWGRINAADYRGNQ